MRRALVGLALAVAYTPMPVAGASPAATDLAAPTVLSVELDQTALDTRIGRRFTFSSVVSNPTGRPLTGLIAHLNVLSVDAGVVVDPEDWSAERTRYLPVLAPGVSVQLRWEIQAVNSGRFIIYVGVPARDGTGPISASRPLEVRVSSRRSLNADGVLPLALGIPGALLLPVVLMIRRRRRLSRPAAFILEVR